MKRATSIARDQLVSLGVCIGKFTHSDKFRLTIGALELLGARGPGCVAPSDAPAAPNPSPSPRRGSRAPGDTSHTLQSSF